MAIPTVMTFPTLDQAESALDWIGLDFADAEGGFEGDLVAADAELLDEAIAADDTPDEVRALARALRTLIGAHSDGAAFRVAFEA